MNEPLVTVAIPLYRRLHLLSRSLKCVAGQTYANIELLVSDNGGLGDEVTRVVEENYTRPWRLRRNETTAPVIEHFNQLVSEAAGEYFVLLCDDDEISPGYVSSLTTHLRADPAISVGVGRSEAADAEGRIVPGPPERPPPRMSGLEFIRAWCEGRYGLRCLVTHVTRTADLRRCGMFPDFPRGYHSDNALFFRLCLMGDVALDWGCWFRWQIEETSLAWSSGYGEMAAASRSLLQFLRSDPLSAEYRRRDPRGWREADRLMRRMAWKGYLHRWNTMRRGGASHGVALRSALAYPWEPEFHARTLGILARDTWRGARRRLGGGRSRA